MSATRHALAVLGIVGAEGALGRAVCRAAAEEGLHVGLKATRLGWCESAAPQVLLNVASRTALEACVNYCRSRALPLIEGCSALEAHDLRLLERLSRDVAVLHAQNFTFGHELQRRLLEPLAATGWGELAILERHPSRKRDRPSATAKLLAEAWERARGAAPVDVASQRGGLAVSDHRLTLAFDGEEVVIEHRVTDRRAAARGALAAAHWIVAQSPGLWRMEQVYGQVPKKDPHHVGQRR